MAMNGTVTHLCENTVYGGSHTCGPNPFVLQRPDGSTRRFCDSDCLRGTLEAEHEAFVATVGGRTAGPLDPRIIEELQAAARKATPGPWEDYLSANDGDGYRVCMVVRDGWGEPVIPSSATGLPHQGTPSVQERWDHNLIRDEDCRFIVLARNHLPLLLREIARLRAEVQQVRGVSGAVKRTFVELAKWTSDPRARDEAQRILGHLDAP